MSYYGLYLDKAFVLSIPLNQCVLAGYRFQTFAAASPAGRNDHQEF